METAAILTFTGRIGFSLFIPTYGLYGPPGYNLGQAELASGSVCSWAADFNLNSHGASVLAQLSSNSVMQPDRCGGWALKLL